MALDVGPLCAVGQVWLSCLAKWGAVLEPSPPQSASRRRRLISLIVLAAFGVVAALAWPRTPEETALSVRSRGKEPPTVTTATTQPVPSTTSTTAAVTTTSTSPATTTSTRPTPSTTTSRPTATPTGPSSAVSTGCTTSKPLVRVPGPGVSVLSPDGTLRQLIDTSGTYDTINIPPVWSPDGTRLATVRLSGAGAPVVVVDLDGHQQIVSGSDKVYSKALAWTPDGKILYAAYIDASPIRSALRIASPDGGEVSTVWEGPVMMDGVSSVAGLDDGRILFLNDDGLMIVNRDGSELHPIGSVLAARPGPFWARAFAVSPDHRRVATIANDGLAMWDISTGRALATGSGANGNAILEWSSDSRRVAYSGGAVLSDDGTISRTGASDVAFPAAGMAITTWRNDGSADDGLVELVAADGTRRIVTRHAWEITGGPTLAAIIAPPGKPERGVPQGGTTLCLLGQPRALAAFPNSEPGTMRWSPDGRYLSVVSVGLDTIVSKSPDQES